MNHFEAFLIILSQIKASTVHNTAIYVNLFDEKRKGKMATSILEISDGSIWYER